MSTSANEYAPGCAPDRIEACRRGDRQAIAQVLREHAPVLERLVARLVGRGADQEDVLQETYVEAIRSFHSFRGESSVSTWLCRIAVHCARRHHNRPDRRRMVHLEVIGERDGRPLPDQRADARRKLERVGRHLDELPPRQRTAFLLHVVEGMSIKEVADAMEATRTATASRVYWARRTLMRRLGEDRDLRALLGSGKV